MKTLDFVSRRNFLKQMVAGVSFAAAVVPSPEGAGTTFSPQAETCDKTALTCASQFSKS
jgi:hypothetical protein